MSSRVLDGSAYEVGLTGGLHPGWKTYRVPFDHTEKLQRAYPNVAVESGNGWNHGALLWELVSHGPEVIKNADQVVFPLEWEEAEIRYYWPGANWNGVLNIEVGNSNSKDYRITVCQLAFRLANHIWCKISDRKIVPGVLLGEGPGRRAVWDTPREYVDVRLLGFAHLRDRIYVAELGFDVTPEQVQGVKYYPPSSPVPVPVSNTKRPTKRK